MRYAIYYAAEPDDALMGLGATWLGRDANRSSTTRQPDVPGIDPERMAELTADPRRYGFHGTLKAPFALKSEASEADILAACAEFASRIAPFELKGLSVNRLGKFLALTPIAEEPDLAAFAEACVRHFEPLRAPLSEADLERRRRSGLTEKLDGYLTRWGYPYIFDEFRFHMTLSNKLESEADATALESAAKMHFRSVVNQPRRCATFGLYTEAERGAPFHVHTIFELSGNALPSAAIAHEEFQ
jgi:putative phosphonate metabolism protein